MKMSKKDVLTFRVETTCTFGGTLYKATDECKSDEQGLWQFPADMIFEVPQHFKAVESGLIPPDADGYRALIEMGPDDETEALRGAFFKDFLAITRDGSKEEAQRHAEAVELRANYLKFGQAKDPAGEAPVPVVPTQAELEAEALRKENEELRARLAALDEGKKGKVPEPEVAPVAEVPAPEPAPATPAVTTPDPEEGN
jgi:hypothetical protein